MRILQTPDGLRQPPTPYPKHSVGLPIEIAAYDHLLAHDIDTPLIYLPIFWQNNYFRDRSVRKTKDYGAVSAVQDFLDRNINPNERYFTVSQADEGCYERLPSNVVVFSAGGVGHIPIPLLCDDHRPIDCDRTLLASFIGTLETGGPVWRPAGDKPTRSSWDINGPGARVRRATRNAFNGKPDCLIENSLAGISATERFIKLACSSKFALAPRGYGRTSFRLYEAMKLGAVPVYIFDDCWLPYSDVLDWERLAVLCHVSRVFELPDRLSRINDQQLADYREYARSVIPDYFTMAGACRQIARYVSCLD